MRIAHFPNQAALNSRPVMDAFLQGCKKHNIEPVEDSLTADAAVIWSVLWNGRMAKNELVYHHYRKQNKPVICIDAGALNRGVTWKIAVNNINAHGYYGHQDNLDWDRPARLGIKLTEPQNQKSHIVIAAQHQKSLQLAGINLENWIVDTVNQLTEYTDRKIYVRPHPRDRLNYKNLPSTVKIETPCKLPNTYDSFNIDFNCHAIVNYNSGPGIQSALHGCRPIVDSSSLAHPVSISINEIESSYLINRDQWLVEICHTEYTVTEIAEGLWVHRLNKMF